MGGRRSFFIHDLHQKYGPVVRISPYEVAISNLEDFQKIHKIGSGFLKSLWYQKLANFPKPGVFTMVDTKEHGPRRKLLSRPFSRSFLVEHWEPIVKEKVELCISQIKKDAEKGCADVFKWWMLLASDVSAHLAFGESFRMLHTGEVSYQ
jgi:cytochrome P450